MFKLLTDYLSSIDIFTILIFFFVILFCMLWITRPKSDIPGPPAWPIFGNIFTKDGFIYTDVLDIKCSQKFFKRYGPIYRRYMGPYEFVYISGHSMVLQALKKQGDDFVDRPNWVPFLRAAKLYGLVWSNGELWKSVRRFTLRTLRDFGVGKKSIEEKILDEAHELVDQFQKSNRAPVTNCKEMMLKASCNIIHSLVFGYRCNKDDAEFNELIKSFKTIFTAPGPVSVNGMFPIVILFNTLTGNKKLKELSKAGEHLMQYVSKQIDEHKKTFDENNINDFVDVYIQSERAEEKKYQENTLFATIADLFGAGTDTTATTLHWALLYMMQYPGIQKKCHDEILKVVGSGRDVLSTDKPSLPYVDATLLEIQRKVNTAPGSLLRMATRDTMINGYKIKKGTTVIASLVSVHEDETIWKNPKEFDPNRFLDSEGKIINREFILPFSTGPRNCAGEGMAKTELFLIFSNLIQRLSFSKVDPDETLPFDGIIGITHSARPYQLRATVV